MDSMPVQWGSISIVFAQMKGFFELLEWAEWDYVINLSAYDYPMMSAEAMYAILSKDPGKAYIEHWRSDGECNYRLSYLTFTTQDQKSIAGGDQKQFSLKSSEFKMYKQHQWMILPRDFVRDLKASQDARDLLAHMEHSLIPDEHYFIMIAMYPSFGWSNRIISDAKRYIEFQPGSSHPRELSFQDRHLLMDKFLARKIHVEKQLDLIQWMDSKRLEKDRELGRVRLGVGEF
jgi:hypothetical protein